MLNETGKVLYKYFKFKEHEKNKMSISLRDFVPEQGRKTEFGGPNEAFSDAALVEKIQ